MFGAASDSSVTRLRTVEQLLEKRLGFMVKSCSGRRWREDGNKRGIKGIQGEMMERKGQYPGRS
jgi:hypothetical protein